MDLSHHPTLNYPEMLLGGVNPTLRRVYANLSEIVRAGMRLLMEERGATAFYKLKAELEEQVRLTRAGKGIPFDPREFEPRTFK